MVHQLNDNGTMAVVLPHGVLFRGAAEGHIRKYLIHNLNYLDAVIGLPANIFYGTSIPTCILVLNKSRASTSLSQRDSTTLGAQHILFIDASQHFEKVKTQNQLRPADIEKIIDTYRLYANGALSEAEIEKYSHVAPLTEIAENDYNLNIPRYVDTFEEEEPVDLNAVSQELKDLEKAMETTDQSIAAFCAELNIKTPF